MEPATKAERLIKVNIPALAVHWLNVGKPPPLRRGGGVVQYY